MDWNRSSFTSKKPTMPYMETVAMVQHSVEAMTFILLTMQAPIPTHTLIWVTVTCKWLDINIVLAIRKTYWPESTIFSPMKWKYFTRRTKTDIIKHIFFCARLLEQAKMTVLTCTLRKICCDKILRSQTLQNWEVDTWSSHNYTLFYGVYDTRGYLTSCKVV